MQDRMHKKRDMRQDDTESQGEMPVSEAGRKGGETTAERHSPEFYSEIGKKGGGGRKEDQDHSGYRELASMGDEARAEKTEESEDDA